MNKITESQIEEITIKLLESQGYNYLTPEVQENERENLSDVVLYNKLENAIDNLNPTIPAEAKDQALKTVLNLPTQNLIENNEAFHKMLTEGIEVEYMAEHGIKGDKVWLVDFENVNNNEFVVCNQFTVETALTLTPSPTGRGPGRGKRPDVVLFVNGLPLVVIELKNPADENATIKKAFTQLQNYKSAIPDLFFYNGLLIVSDGIDAKAGSLTAGWTRFNAWKTKTGENEEKNTIPQIETLISGLLKPAVLLDIIKQFTVFEKSKRENSKTKLTVIDTVKKISYYHQYYSVKKAVDSTKIACQENGNRKAGVIWHTQGSGKSLSMVFYAGEVVLGLDNPTIVVITDRNDLDDQLFDTFAGCKQLLRQEPVQAENRVHLKKLLKVAGGGIVFTTIQKFSPEDRGEIFDLLSERKNIVVIADEAHRSQYGFGAKTLYQKDNDGNEVGTRTTYGFAKYLRDALPNASFIGFTGTPIEKEDASTPAVFGNYIDVYDIAQAVEDGATVRIYYESRLAKVHLKPEEKEKLDAEVEAITEGEESTAKEKAKARWTQLEAIVGHKDRLKSVSKDIVDHFEKREEVFEGKALIVAMSRRIAVELYNQIISICPSWHSEDKRKGVIKVVMTSASSDPQSWQMHNTTKEDRKAIGERLKDPDDPLKLVIVRDMWLTGFDAPCLHTMYVDKPMRGHNLMQAIARVNRVFKDKPGGLIVDYIGIASDLKSALAAYTESGGKGAPALDQNEAVSAMLEKFEIVTQMFDGFDYKKYFTVDTREKMTIILEAQEYVLGLDDGKNRFTQQVSLLSKSFALSVPNLKAMAIKDDIGFFQAVKARLTKFEPAGSGKSDEEIKTRTKKNFILSKKLSEMLENAIKKYQNNLLTTAQIIEELISLAKDIKESDRRNEQDGAKSG